MTGTLYLWLLGLVLAVAGGALISRGWWLDKAAGNHKRPRCRRCWYELGATAPNAEGVTVCPECGTQARRVKDLHRVRRNGWVVLLGVVLVGGGVFLAGRPVMNGGNWLYLLPRWAAARLWKPVGAQSYGQQLKWRVANGTATEAEIASVAEGAKDVLLKGLKARPGTMVQDIDTALAALAKQPEDPEVDAAVASVLMQGPFNSRAAVKFFETRQMPMARRVELCEAAANAPAAAAVTSPPNGYFEMLAGAKDDPAAMRGLVRAASSGGRWDMFARHSVIAAAVPGLQAIAEEFRSSKDAAQRKRLARLFEETFPHNESEELTPFVLELCDDPATSMSGMTLLTYHGQTLKVPDAKLKEWILGKDVTRRDFALREVGCQGDRLLPEGCGAVVIDMWKRDESLPCAVASKFSGSDRALWLRWIEKGDLASRRAACDVVAQMRPVFPEAEALLRKIEGDQAEAEEMRVAARDGLRRMGVWKGNDQRAK